VILQLNGYLGISWSFRFPSEPLPIPRQAHGKDGKTFRVPPKDVTYYLDQRTKKKYVREEEHTGMEESTVEWYNCSNESGESEHLPPASLPAVTLIAGPEGAVPVFTPRRQCWCSIVLLLCGATRFSGFF
jgi:hypothetical protein